jgi:hypothetical protein
MDQGMNIASPYLVRGYTEDQAGMDIRPDDVARPFNHRYSLGPGSDVAGDDFRLKNVDRAPTYGSCWMCRKSGPLGIICDNPRCGDEVYKVVFMYNDNGERVVVDSIWISEVFEAGHRTAKADQRKTWLSTPNQTLGRMYFEVLAAKQKNEEDKAEIWRRYEIIERGINSP